LLNTAVTDAVWPPASAFSQLNEVDSDVPETLALARFILFDVNVTPALPDVDHDPPAEIVYEFDKVGDRPSGSVHRPDATSDKVKSRGLFFSVNVPDVAEAVHAEQG